MKANVAIVKNIVRLQSAIDSVMHRDVGVEGLCVVYGATGAGKTTAITWVMNRLELPDNADPIYVEASPAWSLNSMLADICRACGVDPKGRASDIAAVITQEMGSKQRPLFVDEVDHMFLPGQQTTLRMIEQLRSLYDRSSIPVIMIGMDKIDHKLKMREQLARRVFQWVEFKDLDQEDIRITADTICEIPVADDFLAHLVGQTQGRMGRIILGLAQAERRAKANRWDEINMDRWGKAPLNVGR
jgi:DNA transposition AAA+ family ATPase